MIVTKKRYQKDMTLVAVGMGATAAMSGTAIVLSSIALKRASVAKTTAIEVSEKTDVRMAATDANIKTISTAVRDIQDACVRAGMLK